jgi:hypothetical protein
MLRCNEGHKLIEDEKIVKKILKSLVTDLMVP